MTKASDTDMFGCTAEELKAGLESSIGGLSSATAPMIAMSILSDSQELLAIGNNEVARQYINRAKWVIGTYLMPDRDVYLAALSKHLDGRSSGAEGRHE